MNRFLFLHVTKMGGGGGVELESACGNFEPEFEKTLQLHADLSVSLRNGWLRWILLPEGSLYSFGHSLRQPRRMMQISSFSLGWEKVRTLQEDQEANSKDRNNCLIKQPWAAKLREYSFVLDICRNCEESLKTFDGFKFFAKYLKLLLISMNEESFERFEKKS